MRIIDNKLQVFLCFFLFGAILSCEFAQEDNLSLTSAIPLDLEEKFNKAKGSNVDSALHYSNLILDYIRENELRDSLYIKYNSHKAFLLVKNTHQDQALQLLMDNYLLASTTKDSMLIVLTSLDLANYYFILLQYPIALPYATKAVNYFKAHPGHLSEGNSLRGLGKIHLDAGDLYQALEYFNVVVDINTTNRDTQNLADALADQGYTMLKLGLPDKALDATRKGIQLITSLPNSPATSVTLGSLAINYKEIYPDSAIFYQEKAIDQSIALGDSLNWVVSLYNLGNSLFSLNRYDEAEKIYLQVLEFCKSNGISQGIALSYNALGVLYLKTFNPAKSLQYAALADRELRAMGSTINVVQNLEALIKAHIELGNLQQAQELQMELDSLQNHMQLLQTQNTTKYVEQAIASERAAYENQLLRKSAQSAGEKVKQREIALYALFTIFVFAFAIGILWRRAHLAAQQTTQVLLNRYAAEIQSKKTNQPTQEDKGAFFIQIARQFRELMDQQKLYLQPGLKAEDILEHLNISYNDLNQLLKAEFQSSFPQVINQYRVQEAQKLLSDSNNPNLPLDQIGNLAGFGTRQNFYKTFQYQTGVSPGAFRAYFFQNELS